MSQHAYMWNRNNAFLYEDPSGYLSLGDIWNFLAGDDIATIKSPNASDAEKAMAVADLALLVAPDVEGLEFGGKAIFKLRNTCSENLANSAAAAAGTSGTRLPERFRSKWNI